MSTRSKLKYLVPVLGLAGLLVSAIMFTKTQEFLDNAVTANGIVVDLVEDYDDDDDSTTYRPVVEFVAASQEVTRFTSSIGTSPPSYQKGEAVEVLYLERSPQEARIHSFMHLWSSTLLSSVLGLIFFLAGCALVFTEARGRSSAMEMVNG